jgi:hypothetical protein
MNELKRIKREPQPGLNDKKSGLPNSEIASSTIPSTLNSGVFHFGALGKARRDVFTLCRFIPFPEDKKLDQSHGNLNTISFFNRTPQKLLRLEGFLNIYRTLCNSDLNPNRRWKPVRICIIDTGIDISATKLAESVEKGKSFVHTMSDGRLRESPWYLASEAHGTQMASLIQDIDHYSRLYIAKVGTDRNSIVNLQHIQEVCIYNRAAVAFV